MVAIHGRAGQAAERGESGIRPFDIGRDLRPVARLIAQAFADELDEKGRAALRELRIMSYMGGFIRLLSRSTSEFRDIFNGFVWIEDGQLVGNVTIQKADSRGYRWQIANVAVAPAYRGRGISRALMERALRHIQEMGGAWAVLQVRANNTVARGLYERLGFENLGGHTKLVASRTPQGVPFPRVTGLISVPASQGRLLYDLATSQPHPEIHWWRAPRRSQFQVTLEQQLGEWFNQLVGRQAVLRRAIQHFPDRYEAALVLTARRWHSPHEMKLWVRPEQQGKLERPLIQWALATLQEYPRWPVQILLSTVDQAARRVLEEYGFQEEYTLLTMRRSVKLATDI